MITTLTLTRHGQTVENQAGILQGHSAGHLNEVGLAQARLLRDKLRAEDFDLILSSDLERTRLTAEILNEPLGLKIIFTPLLRERDWGEFTGLYIRQITMPPSDFPASIENAQQLALRAKSFLSFVFDNFEGKRLLCVGHGYFNRCVQALIEGKTVRDTPRWENTELRSFKISREVLNHVAPTDYLVSEN